MDKFKQELENLIVQAHDDGMKADDIRAALDEARANVEDDADEDEDDTDR